MRPAIKFIAAIDDELGLAKNGIIPWDLPSDRKFFRDSISSGPGLMGWGTFASNNFKPFKTCPRNIVITDKEVEYQGVEIIHDLKEFIKNFEKDLWIIGGGNVFAQLLPYATHLYVTRVQGDFECDVTFPEFEDIFELKDRSEPQLENGIGFVYELWVNPRLQ